MWLPLYHPNNELLERVEGMRLYGDSPFFIIRSEQDHTDIVTVVGCGGLYKCYGKPPELPCIVSISIGEHFGSEVYDFMFITRSEVDEMLAHLTMGS